MDDLREPLLTADDFNTTIDTKRYEIENNHDYYDDDVDEDDKDDDEDDDVRAVWFICSMKVVESGVECDDEDDDDDNYDDLEKNEIKTDTDNNDNNNDDENITTRTTTTSNWYWNCMISAILPLLLYFQFYLSHRQMVRDQYKSIDTIDNESEVHVYASTSSSSVVLMNWSSIQWSIFLFVVTSILYRQSMMYSSDRNNESKSSSTSVTYYELVLHLIPDIIIDIILVLILFQQYIIAILFMQISTILLAVNAILNSCNCSIHIGTTTSTSTEIDEL